MDRTQDQRQRSARMLIQEAANELDEGKGGRPDRRGLSIGGLMLAMTNYSNVAHFRGDKSTRIAEWRAADENALLLRADENLSGLGHFAADVGQRDCFIADWDWLRDSATRAMSATPGAKGGYMVGNTMLPAADPLWQDSLIGRAGVDIIAGLSNNGTIPRGTGAVTTTWQAGDGTAPAAVDAALGSVSVTAKSLLATVQCSVQVLKQAPSLADFLSRLLLRSVRAALDTALLQGSGASGQPMGLANLPTATGIQTVSGSSLAWAGILSAQQKVSTSGVPDSGITWVGAPSVRETLAQRERISTSGLFLWENGKIANNFAFATPDCPSATLFVGDFSQAVLALFGPGVEIRFDPNNNFNAGLVAFQVLCVCDLCFVQPAAFVRISSIS